MSGSLKSADLDPIGELPADIWRARTGRSMAGTDSLVGVPLVGTLAPGQVWVLDPTGTMGIPGYIEDLGTAETDASLVLAPDGTGGMEFRAESGGGGRPPFDYVVAPSDSAADMQAIADAVCDGTADEVEINAAINAAVTADRPYSILCLPGTYSIAAKADFTPLTAMNGKWVVFEASGTTIIAGANLTTMIGLDPGVGGQIVTCLDLRLGKLSGNASGGKTVTQIVNLARTSDNLIRIEQIVDGSGIGFKVSQSGVSDYPAGNNRIDIEIIHTMSGNAMTVTGGTGAYGFQGNSVHVGEIIGCANGIVLGASANQDATYNSFYLGIVEHIAGNAIQDYCGANTFIVGGMNTNGKHLAGPTGMSLKSTYIVTIDTGTSGTIDAAVLDQHFVQINGQFYGRMFMAARSSTPTTPGSGIGDIYFKTDGHIYALNDGGTETRLDTSAAPSFATPSIGYGTPAGGAASTVIRSDATIAKPTAADVDFSSDVATSNATTGHHGLLPKLDGNAAHALLGDGTWGAASSGVTGSEHAHVVSETHLSNGSTVTWTLDQAYMTGSVIAWNTTTLARLDVTEVAPDQATVSAAGTSGDKIVFDYAAIVV